MEREALNPCAHPCNRLRCRRRAFQVFDILVGLDVDSRYQVPNKVTVYYPSEIHSQRGEQQEPMYHDNVTFGMEWQWLPSWYDTIGLLVPVWQNISLTMSRSTSAYEDPNMLRHGTT
eukprot:scaffold578_cov167-Amphora_coffeaeformis.AAC.56